MAYGPAAPPKLIDNAEAQRRQITDYIRTAPAAATTGQGFVNDTNTSILQQIQKNNNLANDNNPQNQVQSTVQKNANTAGNKNALKLITPQGNMLDKFASTTWTASVYLLSPAQYTELILTKKKRVNGYNLLFQSGGAPNNVGGYQGALNPAYKAQNTAQGNQSVAPGTPGSLGPDAGRNPAFGQDFYIDSVIFENALPGKQTQMAHSVFDLKFTVVEPSNITLLDRLHTAVQDMAQTTLTGSINYCAAQYLMVIRWYGYDINGNLIAGRTAPDNQGLSDTNAIVEKFIPFLIKKINWSVSNKLVQYDFECAPVQNLIAGGTRRATVPYDVQLTSLTVGGLLEGPVLYSNQAAPPNNPGASTAATAGNSKSVKNPTGGLNSGRIFNAQNPGGRLNAAQDPRTFANQAQQNQGRDVAVSPNALAGVLGGGSSQLTAAAKAGSAPTSKTTLTSGLAAAMTKFSADLVTKGTYKVADTYSVVFADGAEEIKNAEIYQPGRIIPQYETDMGVAPSANPNLAIKPEANPTQIKSKKWAITAGMQFVQAIDLAIRNSSYIYNQALTVIDAETGKEIPNPKAKGKPVQWYKISMQAIPRAYDPARNDFAYNIVYVISKYEIPNFDSKYFPLSQFRGVHKSYPYWFTGQNTSVLDFTANFNPSYNMTVSGGPGVNSGDENIRQRATSNTKDLIIYSYAARSQESNKGEGNKGMELGANAAEYLYAYSEPGGTRLRIIGDPAWIQQGSLNGGVTENDISDSPFDPDGTINFDAGQVLFEIAWQRPEDYNLNTGLADPYARPGLTPGQPVQTNVYQCIRVTSELKGGKFEQTLLGALYTVPIPPELKTAVMQASASSTADKAVSDQAIKTATETQAADPVTNRLENANFANLNTRPQANSGSAEAVNATINSYARAGRLAAANQTGTPSFSSVDFSPNAALKSTFTAAPPLPPDLLAVARYPQAPTGTGVQALSFQDAPLPLNTTLQNVRTRIQRIVKDQ